MTTPTPKRYDESFKRSAVEHWLSSGKKAKQVAAELGVSSWNLRDWRKRFGPPAPQPSASGADLQDQIRAPKAELLRTQQQRDILKKTLGIFADPQSNTSNG
jgi:transposase-like protein